ncbi:tyrosine-type recombinase/integrase [Bacillus sp. ISL-46]|uniref:tyrosine-type recombinase/integrase n=1 Tax=Bacillus sp. ISL-46 TaxID=2819129 RepID=UPI001BEBB290|nr:tyrosine-type recombinase/integrase [Bacillus sp. ISL-46]MBT2723069.1 tyrosine-type recombinase/integrase [Bacillus sp. ISL-46]
MSNNPIYRKTKKYTNQLATKIFTIDDARNIVMKIKQLEGLSPNSIANYEKLFNDFDRFFGEKKDVASLTRDDAREFIYWQLNEKIQFKNHKYRKNKKKGISVSSVNTYIGYGKAAFTALVNEEIVEVNIFEDTNQIKEKEKKIETLTIDEINKLLRSLNKGWYSEFRMFVLINCLLDTFGRITEVLSIRKDDIDFEKHAITFQNTKSGKVRIVPVTKKTINFLEELIEETEDFESEYVFLTHHGKPLTQDTARKHLRDLVKRIGLGNKIIGFHIFRHTASEMFLRQNGSMRVLQKILGHSDISTTSIYAHVLDSTIQQQHHQFSPLNLIDEKEKRKTTRKGKLK